MLIAVLHGIDLVAVALKYVCFADGLHVVTIIDRVAVHQIINQLGTRAAEMREIGDRSIISGQGMEGEARNLVTVRIHKITVDTEESSLRVTVRTDGQDNGDVIPPKVTDEAGHVGFSVITLSNQIGIEGLVVRGRCIIKSIMIFRHEHRAFITIVRVRW